MRRGQMAVKARPSEGAGRVFPVVSSAATAGERRKRRRWLRGRTLLVMLIIGYCAVLSLRAEWQIHTLNRELAREEAARKELLQLRESLETEKRRLNDPAYLEQVAREELGLVRPGEVLVVPGDRLNP